MPQPTAKLRATRTNYPRRKARIRTDAVATAGRGRLGTAGRLSAVPAPRLPGAQGRALERAVHRDSAATDGALHPHPRDRRGPG